MIKAIVVDDEQHAIDSFVKIAGAACPDMKLIACYKRPDHMLEHLSRHELPDVLFLDVEMTPYSGFRLLELMEEQTGDQLPFDVIFLTAYDQYAIKAFKYNALDYLLKPLLAPQLVDSMKKWEQKKHKHLHPVQWKQLSHFLKSADKKQDRMAIPTLEGYEIILFENIIRCEADRNYTQIFNRNGQTHVVCRSLKEVENILEEQGFIRVHHSHIINPAFVTKILKADGGTVELSDGMQVRITRNKEENMNKIFECIKKL